MNDVATKFFAALDSLDSVYLRIQVISDPEEMKAIFPELMERMFEYRAALDSLALSALQGNQFSMQVVTGGDLSARLTTSTIEQKKAFARVQYVGVQNNLFLALGTEDVPKA